MSMRNKAKGDLYKQLEYSLLQQNNWDREQEAVSKSMVGGYRVNQLDSRNPDLNQTENFNAMSHQEVRIEEANYDLDPPRNHYEDNVRS